MIFVHGGPGLYTEARRIDEGAVFRRLGFTTAYYDRAGAGVSDRLPAAEYSFEREISDLEAFRDALKAERVILWGNSYGASLSAGYAARFPEHVAGMILTSPGTFPGDSVERDFSKTQRTQVEMSKQTRDAILLIDKKGAAAESTLGQVEAGLLFDALVSTQLADGFVCKDTQMAPPALPGGGNLYVQRMITRSAAKAKLVERERAPTPTLIIRGSCDFMPAENAARYRGMFGGEIVTLEGVGHGLLENRAAVDDAIEEFLKRDMSALP